MEGRTDGSVTVSLLNFVGEGIISLQTLFGRLNYHKIKEKNGSKFEHG
jgi:hypothetical protein